MNDKVLFITPTVLEECFWRDDLLGAIWTQTFRAPPTKMAGVFIQVHALTFRIVTLIPFDRQLSEEKHFHGYIIIPPEGGREVD